jgi:hypothetical protein
MLPADKKIMSYSSCVFFLSGGLPDNIKKVSPSPHPLPALELSYLLAYRIWENYLLCHRYWYYLLPNQKIYIAYRIMTRPRAANFGRYWYENLLFAGLPDNNMWLTG